MTAGERSPSGGRARTTDRRPAPFGSAGPAVGPRTSRNHLRRNEIASSLQPVTIPDRVVRRRSVGFASDLRAHGSAPAVLVDVTNQTPGGWRVITHAALADLVDAGSARLAGDGSRRLVLTVCDGSLDALLAHLSALAAGHVSLLAAPGPAAARLVDAFDPDVVCGPGEDGWEVAERRPGTRHDLHPELALLLSTSGSTGAPRVVRLSHDNVESNAAAIVESLGLVATDRAVTTLPMHYCYGLSVVHSHLAAGASVVLSTSSVVDAGFARACAETSPTTVAGVPYTFELLDRAASEGRLPWGRSVRLVTQAGGRLPPEEVCRWAGFGADAGFGFVVMYGQTEATARMAVLPAELATVAPGSVGRPLPGGSFRLDAVGPDGVGDLVYSGPNVMLGYATGPADLALGRVVDELATGDRARFGADGLLEVVGRSGGFAKVAGTRVDLADVTNLLAAQGLSSVVVDLGDSVGVLVHRGPTVHGGTGPGSATEPSGIRECLADALGIPRARVVVREGELPRLASGKPDRAAAAALLRQVSEREGGDVLAVYRESLRRPDATGADSFAGLGGDSLSYVEVAVALSSRLPDLPRNWHELSVDDLVASAHESPQADTPSTWARVETSVALRAVAIVLVLLSHTGVQYLPGGAHALLAVAGYNAARFHGWTSPVVVGSARRLRRLGVSVARVVAPTLLWVVPVGLVSGWYGWQTLLLVNQWLGDDARGEQRWNLWFVESLVALLVLVGGVFAVPAVERLRAARPWAVAAAAAGLGVVAFVVVPQPDGFLPSKYVVSAVLWLFALGWAAAAAGRAWQRVLLSGTVLVMAPLLYPGEARRTVIVAALVLTLVWLPTVRVPAGLVRPVSVVAGASLFVYVTHFAVLRVMGPELRWVEVPVSLALGVAYQAGYERLSRLVLRALAVSRGRRGRASRGRPAS